MPHVTADIFFINWKPSDSKLNSGSFVMFLIGSFFVIVKVFVYESKATFLRTTKLGQ